MTGTGDEALTGGAKFHNIQKTRNGIPAVTKEKMMMKSSACFLPVSPLFLFLIPFFLFLVPSFTACPVYSQSSPFQKGESLDDPLPSEVAQQIQRDLSAWRSASFAKPYAPVAGWPYYYGSDWWIQYPPDWILRKSNPYFFHVTDRRGLAAHVFAQVDQMQGIYPVEQYRDWIFQNFIGSVPVRILAAERKNLFGPLGFSDDTGQTTLWFLRWLHPQAGRMIAALQVTVLARNPLGSTSIQWSLLNSPEAEMARVNREVFGPMIGSAHFTVPKSDPYGEADSDRDGVPDSRDRFPLDPSRW